MLKIIVANIGGGLYLSNLFNIHIDFVLMNFTEI